MTQSQLDDLTPSGRIIRWSHHLSRDRLRILLRITRQNTSSRKQIQQLVTDNVKQKEDGGRAYTPTGPGSGRVKA